MLRSLSSRQGFTLIEMLISFVVLSMLLAVSAPSFLGQEDRAIDAEAKQTVLQTHRVVKMQWKENGDQYQDTATLLLAMTPGEPAFTYRATLPETSYSINPYDVSVRVEDPNTVSICSRSRKDATVYCARFDERNTLRLAAVDPFAVPVRDAGRALLPATAFAASSSTADRPYQAFARGRGPKAEEDALAALPTASQPPSCMAGPGNTGMPGWDQNSACPPPPPSDPPNVVITSGPAATTPNANDVLHFTTNTGGPVSTRTCTFDGQPFSCPSSPVAFNSMTPGAHSFSVTVTGPGGTDTDSRAWAVVSPPNDRLQLAGTGHADSDYDINKKPKDGFEVGAWVKLGAGSGERAIMNHGCVGDTSTACKSHAGWSLTIDSSNQVNFVVMDDKDTLVSEDTGSASDRCWDSENGSNAPVPIGSWNYISAHYNPKDRLRVYVNNKVQDCSGEVKNKKPKMNTADKLFLGAEINPDGTGLQNYIGSAQIAEARLTVDGGPAFVVNPGPLSSPGRLYSPAENGRPAVYLYSFENSLVDSTGNFGPMVLRNGATMASN